MEMVRHYILTRFNLLLWNKDKRGERIEREEWLRERVRLFETYTLPSIASQTCKDFTWVMLMDAESPEWLRVKAKEWHGVCPQLKMVGVKPEHSVHFVRVFQEVVNAMLPDQEDGCMVLTTYLDNDDAVRCDFVEDIQRRGRDIDAGTFIYYDYGIQHFTELGINTRVCYPNNHFTTLVERRHHNKIKTCYGYGSHFLIERHRLAKVVHIDSKQKPMWVEVIHSHNVDNDVKMTLDTRLWDEYSSHTWGCSLQRCSSPMLTFVTRWVPRAVCQVMRRLRDKI